MRLWQIWDECTVGLRDLGGKVGSEGWVASGGQHCPFSVTTLLILFFIIFAFPRNGFKT